MNEVLRRLCDQFRKLGRTLEAHWRIWEGGFVCIMGDMEGCLSRLGFSSGSRFPGEPPRRQRTLALHGVDYRQGPLLPLPLHPGDALQSHVVAGLATFHAGTAESYS